MVYLTNQVPSDGRAADALDTSCFLYLFAGFPLKRVVATGIAHPGTNGEILFILGA